jgi:cytochrome oxidase Cu insertion factor (SCO1/SenC/PrrC family)
MEKTGRTISWSVWIGLLLIIATLAAALMLIKVRSQLAAQSPSLPIISAVPAFALTNQASVVVSREELKGEVWLADIIFTRCAGPCPEMTRKMREIQDALPKESMTRLVTLTTDADHDSPEVLEKYAAKFGADNERWQFLTGDKRDVAALAIDGLKLTALAKPPAERTDPADLFVHSTLFVLVDKAGQLRGSFQTVGEEIEWADVKRQILAAIQKLETEP